MTINILGERKNHSAEIVRVGNRLTSLQLKEKIHESGICHTAIKMAQTGKRPVMGEDGEVEWEEMTEAAHVDMIKFMVKKVLPDAKQYEPVPDKGHDRWAALIESDAQSVDKKG